MTSPNNTPTPASIWLDEDTAHYLRLRMGTFYNRDYLERIVLPLLGLPQECRLLDVGCGYGGLAVLIAGLRPDVQITGVDREAAMLESARRTAAEMGLTNLTFEQGDGHALTYEDNWFDAVTCQTVLTHVRQASVVVGEMARILKPGGVFLAVEYTESGAFTGFDNVGEARRDEAWHARFTRLSRLYMQGKKAQGRGDDSLGVRLPLLATAAGLEVFDVRLNDRVLHVIPPYRHPKQVEYLALLKAYYKPDPKSLERTIETLRAAGGDEEDARWLHDTGSAEAILQAIEDRTLTAVRAFMLYLTFARKPETV